MKTSKSPEDREAFVKDLVLMSIADDYENLERIVPDVKGWGDARGKGIGRDEILQALQALVSEGNAQCYLLSPQLPHTTIVAFDLQRIDQLYFYVTPTGKEIVKNTAQLGVSE